MNIKEILEKEFDSIVEYIDRTNTYIIHDYDRLFLRIINNYITHIKICNQNYTIFIPIKDIYWVIFCIKNYTLNTNLLRMFSNKILKREFLINFIINE